MADDGEEAPPLEVGPKKGSFVFPNGARYDGEYEMKADAEVPEGEEAPKVMIRSGTGVYKLDDNEYEGAWQNDRMHGKGQLKFMKGSLYWGDFVENKFHGEGKYVWNHGAYYMGNWSPFVVYDYYPVEGQDNKMHGDGTFVDESGRQWKGRFYNGQGPGLHTLPANKAPAQADPPLPA